MASAVLICNRALQKLGARRITSLEEDTPNARASNTAYDQVRKKLLRQNTWNFAKARSQLAADDTAPVFGKVNAFQLPTDFLRLMNPYPEDNVNTLDWEIEGRKIYTDDDAPLDFRYIKNITDVDLMDSLFQELLSTDMAVEMCEEITQSNTKKENLIKERRFLLREAKRINAIEGIAAEPPTDTWISVRA